MGTIGPCLFRLARGEATAKRVPLPDEASLGSMTVFDGAMYAIVESEQSATLFRASPPH